MPASYPQYRPETRLVHAGTSALAVRRDLRGAVPHPGLRLRQLRAGRAALQGRGAGLPVFALRQSDGRDVRGAHGGVRGRRSRARDRDRHGGGDPRADGPGEGRRSRRRGEAAVRLLPLRGRGLPAALRRHLDAGRRHRSRRNGRTRCGRTPRRSSWKPRPIRRSKVIDIAEVAKIAHAAGATLVVDNVFATPLLQSPLALGADCVVYSATKHIDGQGRCLGGVILGSEKFIQDNVHNLIRQTGPSMSPFNAWVLLKGLETLSVRVRAADRDGGDGRGRAGRSSEGHAADLSGPAGPSAGRDRRRSR